MSAPDLSAIGPDDVLDLFAGTGWGVACQSLRLREFGVELMPEAVAVREANGMRTLYNDVWDGLHADSPTLDYRVLIASPPCQTFSMAGSGAGRHALDDVLAAIKAGAYLDVERLRELGEATDMRTALVLTPLAHVARDTPPLVVFEQVPPVLPVWQACAEVMREWGYSVWVGILNAEQYGVPQTRKRAVLIARADDIEAKPPTPTHSRYYSRDPERLDPDVLPWVSMAEALGWGMTARPYLTIAANAATADNKHTGGTDTSMTGGSAARERLTTERNEGRWLVGFPRKYDGQGESVELDGQEYRARDLVPSDAPSQVITGKARSWQRFEFVSNDKLANSARRPVDEPAPTVTAGHDSANRVWQPVEGEARVILLDPDPRVSSREHHYHGEQNSTSTRVTVDEASALQSYPEGFLWAAPFVGPRGKLGTVAKTKQFLQIGNAVPPLLARAILDELTS